MRGQLQRLDRNPPACASRLSDSAREREESPSRAALRAACVRCRVATEPVTCTAPARGEASRSPSSSAIYLRSSRSSRLPPRTKRSDGPVHQPPAVPSATRPEAAHGGRGQPPASECERGGQGVTVTTLRTVTAILERWLDGPSEQTPKRQEPFGRANPAKSPVMASPAPNRLRMRGPPLLHHFAEGEASATAVANAGSARSGTLKRCARPRP